MLVGFVMAYLAVTILIGLWAARRVHGSKDFLVAGRSLPLYMNVATVFATWFGAETVLSVSATFAKDGLHGIPGDPFGATVCLVLAALLFSRLFYRLNLLTIGDFYKVRYGKSVEVLTSVAIVLSYLGWTSAQLTALGLVIHVLSSGAILLNHAILMGAAVVLIYTLFGGMWSVAFTDLLQSVVIVVGLILVALLVGQSAGGFDKVLTQAVADGKLIMFPADMDASAYWAMAGAFLAFAFGSIPQQDVFQRMTSARDEQTARRGTLIGGLLYFVIAFVPIFIAYAALVSYPELKQLFASEDAREIQRILPDLVLGKMPLWAQITFCGALLSTNAFLAVLLLTALSRTAGRYFSNDSLRLSVLTVVSRSSIISRFSLANGPRSSCIIAPRLTASSAIRCLRCAAAIASSLAANVFVLSSSLDFRLPICALSFFSSVPSAK